MQPPLDQQTGHRASKTDVAGPAGEFLTFRLGGDSYGI